MRLSSLTACDLMPSIPFHILNRSPSHSAVNGCMICFLRFHASHQCQICKINTFLEHRDFWAVKPYDPDLSFRIPVSSVRLLVTRKAMSVPPRKLYVLTVKYYLSSFVSKRNKCGSDCLTPCCFCIPESGGEKNPLADLLNTNSSAKCCTLWTCSQRIMGN